MSISHSWNGTVLTVTSDSGTSSADLKGDMGIRGPQGIPGKDGVSPKINVSSNSNGVVITANNTDGTISTATVKNGRDGTNAYAYVSKTGTVTTITTVGATGTHTAEVFDGEKGEPGNNGYTPVRETDYWTEEDKQEIKDDSHSFITEQLANKAQLEPVYVQSIDECIDTNKLYVLPDGYIYAYTKASVPGGKPLFNNLLKTSIESDGTPFNGGLGYKTDTRLSSSSSLESTSNATNHMCSGFIPVTKTDTIRIANITGNANNYSVVWFYGSDFLKRREAVTQTTWLTPDENGVMTFTATSLGRDIDEIAYMRFCGIPTETYEDIVCTVNQPIVYSEATEGYAWNNTGLAFVPADYEDRIIALEKGSTKELPESEKIKRIKNWDKPIYDNAVCTLIAEKAKPALTTNDRTIEAIYNKYRTLMANNPKYITETNLGACTSSDSFNPIDVLRFDFKEPDGLRNTGYALCETKPKIIFMSGVHTEWVGIWGLYYALEEITSNPEFEDIRRNAHIIVIPCSNPYCLSNPTVPDGWRGSHVNANGVAIHNNFYVDHKTSGSVGEYNYGGSAPCSELETQYIDKVMKENPDAVAFISCHNNDYDTEYGTPIIWASSASKHMCNVVFRLIDKLSKAWLKRYGDTLVTAINTYKTDALEDGDYRLGRAQLSSSAGTEAKNALKYGIQGVNVEISRMMKVFSGNTDGTAEVMTHGAEIYANLIRTLLQAYDYTDKENYYK